MRTLPTAAATLFALTLAPASTLSAATQIEPPSSASQECVILLHGLARSASSMAKMASSLQAQHYHVINVDYPSREFTVDKLTQLAIPPAVTQCQSAPSIHFVTHSMGGILVRYYLKENTLSNLGKVVMLGPPNQGSEVVDEMGDWPGFSWLNGPAGEQLGTQSELLKNLGPANFNLGIIAGEDSINWILSTYIPSDDDGKVSIKNTKLEGMNEHIVLEVSHPYIMKNTHAINATLLFLKTGSFTQFGHKEYSAKKEAQ